MKKVQLNCVFGEFSPGIRILEDSDADKLIAKGYAVELVDENADEDEISSDPKSAKAKLAEANKIIKALTTERDTAKSALETVTTERDTANSALETVTTERDNALTALELAKGASDGAKDQTAK